MRRSVGQLVSRLEHMFVLSRIDYSNSVRAGLRESTIVRATSKRGIAADSRLTNRDHVTPAMPQSSLFELIENYMHYDAFDPYKTVPDKLRRYGSFRRR